MYFVYIGAFVFFQKSAATYLSFYFKSKLGWKNTLFKTISNFTFHWTETPDIVFFSPFLMKTTVLWLGALRKIGLYETTLNCVRR